MQFEKFCNYINIKCKKVDSVDYFKKKQNFLPRNPKNVQQIQYLNQITTIDGFKSFSQDGFIWHEKGFLKEI